MPQLIYSDPPWDTKRRTSHLKIPLFYPILQDTKISPISTTSAFKICDCSFKNHQPSFQTCPMHSSKHLQHTQRWLKPHFWSKNERIFKKSPKSSKSNNLDELTKNDQKNWKFVHTLKNPKKKFSFQHS